MVAVLALNFPEVKMPRARKPDTVAWLIALAWVRLIAFGILVAFAFAFLSPARSEFTQGAREGFLKASGYTPETYGSYQAGEIVGRGLIPAALTVLLFVFVNRGKLVALRVTAGLIVLSSLPQPASLLLALPILFLTLANSTKA